MMIKRRGANRLVIEITVRSNLKEVLHYFGLVLHYKTVIVNDSPFKTDKDVLIRSA